MNIRYVSGAAVLAVLLAAGGAVCAEGEKMKDDPYKKQRLEMVERQIEARGVKDPRVLDAMRNVERHRFVPPEMAPFAYEDSPLPIGEDQTISQPYIVAYMTELLALRGNEKVLEIGTGSGYQAAVLSRLAAEVYTIEIVPRLQERATALLAELELRNVHTKLGDGFLGWPEHAPYDAIIVTCAVPEIPPPLVEQLQEGGLLVAPEGDWYQELVVLRKVKGRIKKTATLPVRFVPLVRNRTPSGQ